MEAIILAGGFGTRLQKVVQDVPKPMAPINGKPFLHWQISYLQKQGIQHFILSTGYLAEKIESYFGSTYQGSAISYAREEKPLGTGGAIFFAAKKLKGAGHTLILNGDTFFNFSGNAFKKFHEENCADVSIALHYVKENTRYGSVVCDKDSRVLDFLEKEDEVKPAWINTGIYLFNSETFSEETSKSSFSLEKDWFPQKLKSKNIFGWQSKGDFLDIGIPEDYDKAQEHLLKYR